VFESITQRLEGAFNKLRARGKLTDANIAEGLKEIRYALLDADVNLTVVKDFIARVQERAVGQEVIKSVAPGQQIVKIVNDELIHLMGETDVTIPRNPDGPTVVMLCGLPGSGKTTTAGKLAQYLAKKGARPLMVAADLARPAAIEQLKVLGRQLEIPVYSEETKDAPGVCKRGLREAVKTGRDFVILDTAGRLHIDDALMDELNKIVTRTKPQQILFVCDSMTGQDAVNSAKIFHDRLQFHGVILTKLDADTRGGAALSIRAVTGKPIKFVGVGERLDQLEEFHPDRMASRILGMGDIVTLVEKAQDKIDEEDAIKMREKVLKNTFTLTDFYDQLQQIKKMGGLRDIMKMMPGMGDMASMVDTDELVHMEAMIQSMTPSERENPEIIDGSRRTRIANGSGSEASDVNGLVKQFKQMKKVFGNMKKKGILGKMMGAFGGGGMPSMAGMPPGMGTPATARTTMRTREDIKKTRNKRKKERKNKKKGRR